MCETGNMFESKRCFTELVLGTVMRKCGNLTMKSLFDQEAMEEIAKINSVGIYQFADQLG